MRKMCTLLTLIGLLLVSSCSGQKIVGVYKSKISRDTASDKIVDLSAYGRLELIKKHVEALVSTIKRQGNPRYYLLENFLFRTQKQMKQMLTSENQVMNQQVFVPQNREIALKIIDIVAAYEVMNKAGIFLSFNKLLPEENEVTYQNFIQFDRAMGHYQDTIKEMVLQGTIVKIEDKESAYKKEVQELLGYLVTRIEYYYEDFLSKWKDRRNVKKLISKVRKLKRRPAKFDRRLSNLMKSRLWRRVSKKFENLELPESSSIEGSDEAFEKVMSVQVSATLLNEVSKMYLNKE